MTSSMDQIKTRILVVEDNEDLRDFLAYFMNFYDYSFEVALNGQEALQLVISNELGGFDLILSDINMPVMSGFELFKSLRDHGCTLPFVFMTAELNQENLKIAAELEIPDILEKPFTVRQLQRHLNKALGRH
jgi:CheY-like chemotaxis protein